MLSSSVSFNVPLHYYDYYLHPIFISHILGTSTIPPSNAIYPGNLYFNVEFSGCEFKPSSHARLEEVHSATGIADFLTH